MANTQGPTYTFKADLLQALHNFGVSVIRASTAADTFKGALYATTATIGPAATAYTATGEVSGTGYSAGGVAFTFATPPSVDGTSGIVTPSASLTFTGVTLSNFNCVLMYNNSLGGKNSVAAFTFGAQSIVAADFVLTMPVNAAGTALIQLN